ncbi:hypothetical protein B9Z19DRAFT_1074327 [Tuber borchii]|uniref:Uncharacterized protein n=1 Tax=Tuber borchii TaxID=42251 RepID=A0A2T7A4P7_TUBBO|nr:hypothetical protein B9Z19DRAFT_1074327 [Tuber borchii]
MDSSYSSLGLLLQLYAARLSSSTTVPAWDISSYFSQADGVLTRPTLCCKYCSVTDLLYRIKEEEKLDRLGMV